MQRRGSSIPIDEQRADVENVRQQEKSGRKDTAFGRLVLEKGHKNMIVSLITQHFRDKGVKGAHMEQVDIIRGKGTVFSI